MIVYKLDASGEELLHYAAQLMARTPVSVTVRAIFSRDITTDYTSFRTNDRLNEHFYSDRWYNVFALYAGDSERLKGWYCNICRPARIALDAVLCEDLALDVWVSPQGKPQLLDEDEFAELGLNSAETVHCYSAVDQLFELARRQQLPR